MTITREQCDDKTHCSPLSVSDSDLVRDAGEAQLGSEGPSGFNRACVHPGADEIKRHFDLLAAGGLVFLIAAVFWKVIFLGKSISRLHLLAEWDSVFGAFKTGQSYASDPSIMQLLMPYYFTVQHVLAAGELPLWNPYNAFGAPLLADIQSFALSPLRLLFYIHPSVYSYNITLVAQVMLAAVFSYLLARSIGVKVAGSILCGFAYPLCPMILYYAELATGTSNFLLPLVLWSFARLARQVSFSRCAIAAGASALCIVSSHPEGAFFAISFGVLLFIVVSPLLAKREPASPVKIVCAVALTALLTVGLSAPVLFPFAEFAVNADSYKFSVGKSAFVEWYGVVLSLMQPAFAGASPYLGIAIPLCLSLTPFLPREQRRLAWAVCALSVVALALVSRFGILDAVLSAGPLVWLVTLYCLPVFLLFILLVASFGFDALVALADSADRRQTGAVVLAAFLTIGIPLVLYFAAVPLSSGDFDMTIPHMNFSPPSFLRDGIIVLAGFAMVFLLHRTGRSGWAAPALLALALLSELLVARTSLPVRPVFSFSQTPLLTRLKDENVRVLPLGEYILRPNANWVYGISQLRSHNPIFPSGFVQFEELAGGSRTLFEHVFKRPPTNALAASLVGSVITDRDQREWSGGSDRYKHVYTSPENISLYRNSLSLPRAYFASSLSVVASREEALRAIESDRFDPFQQVVVESSGTSASKDTPASIAAVKAARLVKSTNNLVACKFQCDTAGVLVLTDTFYPGWTATVNGVEKPIARANAFFRAVFVEPGRHTVIFEYKPWSFFAGVAMFSFALLSIVVGLLFQARIPARGDKHA